MKKSYRCSAEEWVFATKHSKMGNADRGYRSRLLFGCLCGVTVSVLLLLLYVWLRYAAGAPDRYIQWIWELAPGIGAAICLAFMVYSIVIPLRESKPPKPGETVALIQTDRDGIWFNRFCAADSKHTPMLRWSSITRIAVDTTCDLREYIGRDYRQSRKEDEFAALKRQMPSFREEPAVIYPDRFTIILNRWDTASLKFAILQIPRSWLEDGQFAALLAEMQHYTGLRLEYYRPRTESHFLVWARHSLPQ